MSYLSSCGRLHVVNDIDTLADCEYGKVQAKPTNGRHHRQF